MKKNPEDRQQNIPGDFDPKSDQVYLSLGTNMEDRLARLEAAKKAFPGDIQIREESSIYQTEPWGYEDQNDFLNQVIRVETSLSPPGLLETLKSLEVQLGRTPTFRFGPRVIDLDILLYGDIIWEDDHLVIPHPRMHQRAFVLVPMAEIAPDVIHPRLHQSIKDLLSSMDTAGVNIFEPGPGEDKA